MSEPSTRDAQDWDPLAAEVLENQQLAHDEMRDRCPVAWSEFLGWSLFKHEDVIAATRNPARFSNRISTSPMLAPGSVPSIPLQLDPPEHTPYKRFLISYFSTQRMAAFEPTTRSLAGSLLHAAPSSRSPSAIVVGLAVAGTGGHGGVLPTGRRATPTRRLSVRHAAAQLRGRGRADERDHILVGIVLAAARLL